MVAKDENPPRIALSLDHHNKSKDIGIKAGLKEHSIRLEEEAQINLITEGIAIEKRACNSIALWKTIAFRYENTKYVIRVE